MLCMCNNGMRLCRRLCARLFLGPQKFIPSGSSGRSISSTVVVVIVVTVALEVIAGVVVLVVEVDVAV